MVYATFHFEGKDEPVTLAFPAVARGLVWMGNRPNRCKVTGDVQDVDADDLKYWLANHIQPALAERGKITVDFVTPGEEPKGEMIPPVDNTAPKGAIEKASAIMKYFEYAHLPEELQEVSAQLCEVAEHLDATLPDSEEKRTGLRKLLEAKDCFVRAHFETGTYPR